MKVAQIKARLYARLIAASTILMGQTGTGSVKAVRVYPRTEFEYPVGRKLDGVSARIGLIVLDSDSTHVEVIRKKDNVSLGKFLKSVAEEMVTKAKAQKKASLMIVGA